MVEAEGTYAPLPSAEFTQTGPWSVDSPAPTISLEERESGPVVVWLRRDLRLRDNQALNEAVRTAGKSGVVALYVYAPEEEGQFGLGVYSRWWLRRRYANLVIWL